MPIEIASQGTEPGGEGSQLADVEGQQGYPVHWLSLPLKRNCAPTEADGVGLVTL